ncbi:hypothetical protein L2E82_19632 [Cichorium intybus]|uniref:Uncharacterized protein n=1 Tax=Cichorium intybus TaxID=13427 RepID=A0ACB9FDD6_CICIN|nr:hypothetical protein L2E82_19632 [Cichorium intybus]
MASLTSHLLPLTGCNFSESDNWSCATGDCNTGEVECNGNLYTPPVTTVEFIYYGSLDNGYNFPILLETTGGSGSGLRSCAKTGCIEVRGSAFVAGRWTW